MQGYLLPIETNSQFYSNLIMQLASSESNQYENHTTCLIESMCNAKEFASFKYALRYSLTSLNIERN